MKLICNVAIGNRLLPTLARNSIAKHVKSTLALCKHPKSTVYCIILFTGQKKTGAKYELKENILKVLTRFLNEGKSTIQFKQPPHDLYIQADSLQLKSFMHLLKRALENKISEKELTYSSMSVTPVAMEKLPPKKLEITKESNYRISELPRTLEVLSLNDIACSSLHPRILVLTKLKTLNLSHNCIEFLPVEISNLPNLCELNLSHNCLGKSSPRQWNWFTGTMTKTLRLLTLSHNELKFLPESIVKLHNLIMLHVDNNQLKTLPSGIGNLRNLRVVNASNNMLSSLPGSVKKWQLQSLNFSDNDFDPNRQSNPAAIFPKPLPVCSLKEYAARKVLYSRLYYSTETLPATVTHYLDLAKYCVCGRACFDEYIRHPHMVSLKSISQSYVVESNGVTYVPVDCYFCSLKCFGTANYNRGRNPVT